MQRALLLLCLGLASAVPRVDFDCSEQDNGLAWWGCRSFGTCQNGQHEQFDCPLGTAYSNQDGDCVDIRQAPRPCNNDADTMDCAAYSNTVHRLPDMQEECRFFYTCNYGIYVGHQPCPEGTVYSEQEQNCLSRSQVERPCGDYVAATQ